MPWVTFGCAGTAGMPVTVRANTKDENYFANAASWAYRSSRGGRQSMGESGKGEPSPLQNPKGRIRERLLFLAGKSPFAQLSERHLAAHRLAIGLA
jgi:hypothetical protein